MQPRQASREFYVKGLQGKRARYCGPCYLAEPGATVKADGTAFDPTPVPGSPLVEADMLGVDRVLQRFTRLEAGYCGRFDLNRFARLRVAAFATCTVFNRKGAKAHQGNLVSALERVRHTVDDGIESPSSVGFVDVSGGCDGVDKVRLVH